MKPHIKRCPINPYTPTIWTWGLFTRKEYRLPLFTSHTVKRLWQVYRRYRRTHGA